MVFGSWLQSLLGVHECTQPRIRTTQSLLSKLKPRGTHSHKATKGYQGRRLTQLSTARSHPYYSTFHYLISSNNSPCHPPLSLSSPFLTYTLCTSLSALRIFVKIDKLLVPILAPGPHHSTQLINDPRPSPLNISP